MRLDKEPLNVNFNDSNNQKYVTIPSSKNPTKPYSDIEPNQKIFPIPVDERWDEDFYPGFLKVHELVKRLSEFIGLVEEVALDYEKEQSTGQKPAEELAWVSENMGELTQRVAKTQRKIEEQYNLNDNQEHFKGEKYTKFVIKKEHGTKFEDKYDELKEWQNEKEEEVLQKYDSIDKFDTHGDKIDIEFSGGSSSTMRLNPDKVRESGEDTEIVKFIEELVDIYQQRENKFKAFAEELGYEHRLENTNLGFHQFIYEDFIVEIPMNLPDKQDIDVMKKED